MVLHALKNSHCSFCGAFFLDQKSWPRKCVVCENITYSNPLPVSVSLLKVEVDDKIGIIVVQRANDVKFGEWALPGGYLVAGETWQTGAAREIQEEVGLILNPNHIKCYDVVDATTTNNLLIFNTYLFTLKWNEINFIPNEEVSDIDICFLPAELAFPSHTKYLKQYLQTLNIKT